MDILTIAVLMNNRKRINSFLIIHLLVGMSENELMEIILV